jgi:hypothetical protein
MPTSLISAAKADPAGTFFLDGLPGFAGKDCMRVNLNLVMSQ